MRKVLTIGAVTLVAGLALAVWLLYPDWQKSRGDKGAEHGAGRGEAGRALMAGQAVADILLTAPTPEPQGTLSIRGIVRDAKGPVGGVTVVAVRPGSTAPLASLKLDRDDHGSGSLVDCGCGHALPQLLGRLAEQREAGQPLARVSTDGNGGFALSGLEEGTYTVWAEAKERGTAVKAGIRAGDEQVELMLGPPTSFEGKILGVKQETIAGARVSMMHWRHPRVLETDSSADGTFAFASIPEGGYTLVVTREGYFPAYKPLPPHSPRRFVVRLAPPISISGTVVRAGVPVEGASVGLDGNHVHLKTTTDANGAFSFKDVAPSGYAVTARSGAEIATESVYTGGEREVAPLKLELKPGTEFVVTVQDEFGKPIEGARVDIAGREGPDGRTDEQGQYRVMLAQPLMNSLTVKADGFQDYGWHPVPGPEKPPSEKRVVLRRAVDLKGIVVDSDGKPVSNASVGASYLDRRDGEDRLFEREGPGGYGSAKSAEDGTFSLEHLGPGRYSLSVTHERHATARSEARAPSTGVRVVMGSGIALKGRVLNADGTAAAGVQVATVPDIELLARPRKDIRADDSPTENRQGRTDSNGAFTLEGLSRGSYVVMAIDGEMGSRDPEQMAHKQIELTEGTVPEIELRFPPALAISGKVVDSQGKPVASARIMAQISKVMDMRSMTKMMEHLPRSAESKADGSFVIKGLTPGEYDLNAVHGDFSGAFGRGPKVSARAGDSGVTITLVRQAKVRGRVVRENGLPFVEYDLNGRTIKDPGGAFEQPVHENIFGDSASDLVFKAPGMAPVVRSVKIPEGQDLTIPDVVLGAGRTVRGRVVSKADNTPVAGAVIAPFYGDSGRMGALMRFGRADGEPGAKSEAVSGKDGRFAIEKVESGPVEIEASHADFSPARVSVPAERDEVTVMLDPGATIGGRVSDAQGKPLKGMVGVSLGRPLDSRHAQVAEDGTFEIRGLGPGKYTVRFHGSGDVHDRSNLGLAPKTVDVAAGAAVTVDFAESSGGSALVVNVKASDGEPAGRLMPMLLVPGEAAAPAKFDEYRKLMERGIRGARGDEGEQTFKGLAAGRYTLMTFAMQGQGLGVYIEGIDVDGKTDRTVTIELPDKLPPLEMP
ncbi:MAG: carboxypeptidase regulatory-like domain-containing protein [Deltaproteobacteria bacterium]|nr:carboxypeptidase regulatory-like domain-containing protein [Deltaproteobacteria bacterium]